MCKSCISLCTRGITEELIEYRLCAFLMYAMWWHKPLAPNEPFILKGDWVESLSAFMFMSSEIPLSGTADEKSLRSETSIKTMFAFLHLYSKEPEIKALCLRQRALHSDADSQDRTLTGKSPEYVIPDNHSHELPSGLYQKQVGEEFAVAPSTCLNELRSKRRETAAGTAFFERRPRVIGSAKESDPAMKLTGNSKRRRWDLAATAIRDYPCITGNFLIYSHQDHQEERCSHFSPEELLVARVQNWPWVDLLRDVGGLVVGLVLWLANFGYGAIHAAAWNDHFPTATEKWLWRSSAVYVGFCGGLWIILNYVAQAYRPLNEFWEKWMDGKGRTWQNILIGIPVVICGASLLFARAFLIIEAFVSVRELPASAYMTPTWLQVFPHF